MKRKIIQITTTSDGPKFNPSLFVLCDDGSVWVRQFSDADPTEWSRIKDVPQDDEKAS